MTDPRGPALTSSLRRSWTSATRALFPRESRAVRVKEIKDKSVVLDLNHPLAGKTLVFDVRILSVDGP